MGLLARIFRKSVSTSSPFAFLFGLGGTVSKSREAMEEYKGWVYACVSAIADEIACAGRLLHPSLDPGTLPTRLLENQAGWSKRPAQQSRRDKRAAVTFLRRLLKRLAYVPRVMITDKRASDGAAMREILPGVEHRRHKGRHNRAENAHQPTRERERRMRRCKDPGHAQRFLAAYGPIASHFRPRRHRLAAHHYRQTSAERCATWRAVTGTLALA